MEKWMMIQVRLVLMKTFKDNTRIHYRMFDILQSVVGSYGPLIVEFRGKLYTEMCYVIEERHVRNMIEKIKDISFTEISQTTDRSFVLLE